MGELHLEVLVDRMKREFKVEANVGRPQVSYPRDGQGHRPEGRGPLRAPDRCSGQFGIVYFDIEPNDPGEGFGFVNATKVGSVPDEYIKAVTQGAEESMASGPLAG